MYGNASDRMEANISGRIDMPRLNWTYIKEPKPLSRLAMFALSGIVAAIVVIFLCFFFIFVYVGHYTLHLLGRKGFLRSYEIRLDRVAFEKRRS